MYSLAQICLIEQGPNRPEIIGALIGITLSIAYVLGPVLGGVISNGSWRGIFWLKYEMSLSLPFLSPAPHCSWMALPRVFILPLSFPSLRVALP